MPRQILGRVRVESIELFAGAGGLGLGLALAGFRTRRVVEWDAWACETLRENQASGFPLLDGWDVVQSDVRSVDWSDVPSGLALVAGGPPCQPFSMGGKHGAQSDGRDMFPAAVEVVRRLRPQAFIFENVKGLTRSSFANYFQYILLQLEFPTRPRLPSETWQSHLSRLQVDKAEGRIHGQDLSYNVSATLVNAADYGVPQKRERVFLVGFRSDLGVRWSFPAPTHSANALMEEQWLSGAYWDRHGLRRPPVPEGVEAAVLRLRAEPADLFPRAPWRTVRDALSDLPDPREVKAASVADHAFQPGAKAYPGHTGSPLDQPAKTIKAGDHGVPGGENMAVLDDGSLRYFSVRETARIQTFPDGYRFHGSWSETMRQLGNAVPVVLARKVAASVAEALIDAQLRRIPEVRENLARYQA